MDLPLEIKAAPKAASKASRDVRNTEPDRNKERRCQDAWMKPAIPGVLPAGTARISQRDAWDEPLSSLPSRASFGAGVQCGVLFCFVFLSGEIFFLIISHHWKK